ncbi:hypothetical protein OUZ56_020397 [Daphnia magna]|uniref:Uncharacterized protein n=1 Tax=Daphnia magna TaxID=35525 RepID=A0ABQ9ZED4_9CRUS|nr:hypothetical protein OUZ56_020397 [Daphnia magna]
MQFRFVGLSASKMGYIIKAILCFGQPLTRAGKRKLVMKRKVVQMLGRITGPARTQVNLSGSEQTANYDVTRHPL